MSPGLKNAILSAGILFALFYNPSFAKTEAECLNAVEYGTYQIRKNPADFRGYACRGSAYVYLKKYELAEPDLLKAASLKPGEAGVYVHLTALYTNTKRDDLALVCIRKSIALGNRTESTYNLELAILNSAFKTEECLKLSEEVLRHYPQDSSAYYYLAVSKRIIATFSKEEIEADLNKAIALVPGDKPSIEELEWVRKYYKPKRIQQAAQD